MEVISTYNRWTGQIHPYSLKKSIKITTETEFIAAKPKILVSISSANHKRFHSITVNSVRIWLGGKIWADRHIKCKQNQCLKCSVRFRTHYIKSAAGIPLIMLSSPSSFILYLIGSNYNVKHRILHIIMQFKHKLHHSAG